MRNLRIGIGCATPLVPKYIYITDATLNYMDISTWTYCMCLVSDTEPTQVLAHPSYLVLEGRPTKYTQSGNGRFLAYIILHYDGKISPGWCGLEVLAHPLSL